MTLARLTTGAGRAVQAGRVLMAKPPVMRSSLSSSIAISTASRANAAEFIESDVRDVAGEETIFSGNDIAGTRDADQAHCVH